jgi:low temperature requirement protein LtrA
VLSYGHLAFIGGIIAVTVGIAEAVARPGTHLDAGAAGLLHGGCALYLATFGYTRWRMFRAVSTTRLTAAAFVLALLPVSLRVPGLAALSLVAAALVALNVWEHVRVTRAAA